MMRMRPIYKPLLELPAGQLVAFDAVLLSSSFVWTCAIAPDEEWDVLTRMIEVGDVEAVFQEVCDASSSPSLSRNFGRQLMHCLDSGVVPARLIVQTKKDCLNRRGYANSIGALCRQHSLNLDRLLFEVKQEDLQDIPSGPGKAFKQLSRIGARVILSEVVDPEALASAATGLPLTEVRTSYDLLPRDPLELTDTACAVVDLARSNGAYSSITGIKSRKELDLASKWGFNYASILLPGRSKPGDQSLFFPT